ncbi:MAG: hypothetical protein KAW47_09160 [Thermoplasmatales archaeon]|nr:hypothetical protein [Thermoplasmatales archaeon]
MTSLAYPVFYVGQISLHPERYSLIYVLYLRGDYLDAEVFHVGVCTQSDPSSDD